jgi:hypothetical protein
MASVPPQNPSNNSVSPTVRPSVNPPAPGTVVGGKPGDKVVLTAKPGEQPAVAEMPLVPPDETIWEKYAPNGEPIVSGLASFLSHGLMLLVILVGVAWLFNRTPDPVEELEPVEIGNGEEGGGGGSTEGSGLAPGNLTRPMDEVKSLDQDKTQPSKTLPEDEATVKASTLPTIKDDPLANAFIEKVKSKPNMANLGPVLKDALEGLAGKGQGGSGRGGGEGTGVGKGKGSGTGDGTGKTNRRGRRALRWDLVFTTNDARHYLQQLDALGAVVAVPDRSGKLMTIRDLKARPAKPQYEDVKAMNRIYWVDYSRESADSVASELALDIVPSAVVAFFPQDLEADLLKKELAFRGRKEEDIEYTRFSITFSGGKAAIKVTEQQPFPGR